MGMRGRGKALLAALLSAVLLSQHAAAGSATAPTHPKYELLHEDIIKEFGLKTALYMHIKSGAEVLSVVADDDNKLFGVGFRTPPENDAGAPHVFEHATLSGSTKYPLKDPFAEMLKSSLQTFLNALTYDDFTMYPVSSLNLKDFYNLMDVYLDAVLHPLAIKDPRRLQQEGWHYELEKASDPLTYQGVVMSEMKGKYSNPESALFPDTAYRFDSGGKPAVIPTLTFEYIQDFHKRYYHPANSRVFFYGNDSVMKRLDIVDEMSAAAPVAQLTLLKCRRVHVCSTTEHVVSVNWVLNFRTLSLKESLELSILENLLIGSSAAPLLKALTDSGLGTAPTGYGYVTWLRQSIFTIGLLGVKPSKADAVETLILDTLTTIAKTGFKAAAIKASINSVQFAYLSPPASGNYNRGFDLLQTVMIQWVHDRDPTLNLHLADAFSEITKEFTQGQSQAVFQQLVTKYFIKNTHRVTVDLKPETGAEEREAAKLAKIKAKMTPKQINDIVAQTKALKDWQTKPDSPAARATIPRLSLSDVNKKNPLIPKIVTQVRAVL
ncbi:Metalloenzyme, LuxS/M16 peptidase-like protein [Tribonema minus]|uniref:Metalloenzyme, LuxS/M16 peptidase-like protein n=1 Tax=Tribonema minus TaxID=303371 RepID=A0A835Z554_9STRA|nr:Metalloenzyme, LuxS/M16 peptidase-like protein [Tribonema minus]